MAARRDENLRDEIMASDEHPHRDWIHQTARYKEKPKPKAQGPAKRADMLSPVTAEHLELGRGRKSAAEESHVFRYRGYSHAHSHLSHSSNASAIDIHLGHDLEDRDPRDQQSTAAITDNASVAPPTEWEDDVSSDGNEDEQDIEELWFPGGHADIGGGWEIKNGETPLSHIPLVWIVREAKTSGLAFDEEKMEALNCLDTSADDVNKPTIEVSTTTGEEEVEGGSQPTLKQLLIDTASKALLHDCLRFNTGSTAGTVIRWRVMEWMPFRRLDLTEDGKWRPIRWYIHISAGQDEILTTPRPLPRGEVRDMPANAKVHHSAIKRMQNNPNYRPGNLIVGGGGRGYITAPKSAGIGEWVIAGEEGDVVGERVIRKPKEETEKSNGANTSGR